MRSPTIIMAKNQIFRHFSTKNRHQGEGQCQKLSIMVVRVIQEYGYEVPLKTSGLYHVLKLSNLNHVFKMLLNFRFIKKHLKRKVLVLVRLNIVFFSHVQSRRIYWDSLPMIDGAKHEIEGVNHAIDGAKCQVVKYFVVLSSQIQSILV